MKEITQEFINYVKVLSAKSDIPPIFNPSEWKGSFNCYMYALNINSNFIGYRTNPGFLKANEEYIKKGGVLYYNKENLIKYFKDDCRELGLQVIETTINEKISDNEYKIVVYLNSIGRFHFVRRDSNGVWSEKNGWCGKIEILKKQDINQTVHGYKFVGVYKVSRKE